AHLYLRECINLQNQEGHRVHGRAPAPIEVGQQCYDHLPYHETQHGGGIIEVHDVIITPKNVNEAPPRHRACALRTWHLIAQDMLFQI
ncbi:unnamed protein product, partial [Ectocarpus fasciculatus]